jgi:hypothetical protein
MCTLKSPAGILWCDVPSDIDEDEPSDTVTGSSTDLEAALTQPAPSLHPMPTMTADGVLHPHMSALHPAASQRLHQPTELDAAVTHGPSTAQSASSAIATLEVVPSIKQGGKMGLDSSPHHAPWPPTHQDQDEERVTYMIPQLPYMQQPGELLGSCLPASASLLIPDGAPFLHHNTLLLLINSTIMCWALCCGCRGSGGSYEPPSAHGGPGSSCSSRA